MFKLPGWAPHRITQENNKINFSNERWSLEFKCIFFSNIQFKNNFRFFLFVSYDVKDKKEKLFD